MSLNRILWDVFLLTLNSLYARCELREPNFMTNKSKPLPEEVERLKPTLHYKSAKLFGVWKECQQFVHVV